MSSSERISIDAAKDVKFKDMAALDADIRALLEFDSLSRTESFSSGAVKTTAFQNSPKPMDAGIEKARRYCPGISLKGASFSACNRRAGPTNCT